MLQNKTRRKIMSAALWAAVAAWMALLFCLSAQTGEQSGGLSGKVTEIIAGFFVRGFGNMSEGVRGAIVSDYGFLVRKTAHFTYFLLLAVLSSAALGSHEKLRPRAIAAISVLICFVYACTDEFHQSFVAGRGPAFTDVMIDTCGGITGVIVMTIIYFVSLRPKENRNSASEK